MISEKMVTLGTKKSVIREIFEYSKKRAAEIGTENVFDFSIGNPNVPAPASVHETIKELLDSKDDYYLFGYTSAQGDADTRAAVAADLNKRFGTTFHADNFYMTCGAAASLRIVLGALTVPGDEYIVFTPYFPEYRVFIESAGAAMIEKYGTPLPDHVIDSIRKNGVALKGPITTPVGKGFRSVNVALRKTFDLYANVRPAKTYPGVITRYDHIDLVIVRENTEDLYAGIEHMVGEDAAESIKLITRKGCERICRYAFEYAVREGRKKVTAVHKANIMKCTDGLFLDVAREIAKEYPQIEFTDSIVDAMCMRLVMHPEEYDVLVCPNLYGDIVSDLCAGLVGGLGLTPSANIGKDGAIFEPIHGSAPDIAGQHKINPTACILSASLMLAHLGEAKAAAAIEKAITDVISEGKTLTQDMGGTASTEEFADAVIAKL